MPKLKRPITKPVRVISVYTYQPPQDIMTKLDAAGINYYIHPMFSGFHGWSIEIEKPRGKGTTDKLRFIGNL